MNCLHSFRTKKKLKSLKKVSGNKDFCGVLIHSKDTKILEFNQYRKSFKTPSIIYTDLQSLIKKIDGCKNNSEKLATAKVGKCIPCGCSVCTIWTFDVIENKHDACSGKYCMEKFFKSFREHAMKIINFEKRKMIPLTNEQQKLYEKTKICYIWKKS